MSALARLAAGERLLALGVRAARTADIARMARGAGYAVIWIDLEHSSMSVDCAAQLAAAARDVGLEGWVRIPERDHGIIGRLLDGGADGIVAPRVESAQEARELVMASRFPPRGQRSQIARLPQVDFQRMPPAQLAETIDRRTTVQALLESRRGVDNADAIAAVDGVDLLAVGLNDLSADLGCLGDTRNERMREACKQVAAAAARHGKVAIAGGVADAAHYESLMADGFAPLIFAAIDTDVLASGLAQRAAEWAIKPTGHPSDTDSRK